MSFLDAACFFCLQLFCKIFSDIPTLALSKSGSGSNLQTIADFISQPAGSSQQISSPCHGTIKFYVLSSEAAASAAVASGTSAATTVIIARLGFGYYGSMGVQIPVVTAYQVEGIAF